MIDSNAGAAIFQWRKDNFTVATALSYVKTVYRQLRFHYFNERLILKSITCIRELSQTIFPVENKTLSLQNSIKIELEHTCHLQVDYYFLNGATF